MRTSRVIKAGFLVCVTSMAVATACSEPIRSNYRSIADSSTVPNASNADDSYFERVPDATVSVDVDGGGTVQGAPPPVDASACTPEDSGPGPLRRICKPATSNECDGSHDFPSAPNGSSGNGYDDDCDGLVDEGCSCPAAGVTKPCTLVPPTQISNLSGKPVGWCAANSVGTMECQGGEFRLWSGICRGAQVPFEDDVCAPGDFDCDGKEMNSRGQNCVCADPVRCPTEAVDTIPYPPAGQLPLKVDGTSWILNSSLAAQSTNWEWTLRGGDCDNILPHPTFALFESADGTGSPVSRTLGNLGQSGKERGVRAVGGSIGAVVYPAFSLSGDYFLEGKFRLGDKSYSCLQKVRVRAPGLRAEACWDTEDEGVDLDLHVARVDSFPASRTCGTRGWGQSCPGQDCYYRTCMSDTSDSQADWSLADSPSLAACQGWGSMASGNACRNPRLDRDANGVSGECDPSEANPNRTKTGGFCGPENINVDFPPDLSKYAVALKYFAGAEPSRPHVNIYCNGERVFSAGFDPVSGNAFPVMRNAGMDTDGDMWKVALVTIRGVGAMGGIQCDVAPIPSQRPDLSTDGTAAYCIDNAPRHSREATSIFMEGGYTPAEARALCFH